MNDDYSEAESEKACIIWMHGLGASGSDMQGLAGELRTPPAMIKHVFLDAPVRSVTINAGMMMPAWYDIFGDSLLDREDEVGIKQSQALILDAVNAQIAAGFTPQQIFLAGFSQGGAMALYVGLEFPSALAGIIVLSAYLPLSARVGSVLPRETPIFMASGRYDPIVLPRWTEISSEWLQKNNYHQVSTHEYPMPHSVCHEEIADLSCWIMAQIEGVKK